MSAPGSALPGAQSILSVLLLLGIVLFIMAGTAGALVYSGEIAVFIGSLAERILPAWQDSYWIACAAGLGIALIGIGIGGTIILDHRRGKGE